MSDLMMDGFNLAMFGMGFVFIFLISLVFLTGLMTAMIRRYAPVALMPAKSRASIKKPVAPRPESGDQAKLVAVISAAIRQHRSGTD
jgi:oxaloacetate decarboxylase (Na+ extruding) subunit gamma